MKKISKLQLLIQEKESKCMDEINKRNKNIYLLLIGDDEYKELIKEDALLFYCKYLTENSDGYSLNIHSSSILNKYMNMETYLDTENYNMVLSQLSKEFNSLEYPFTKRYFQLLEQICLYKLYKYLYETSKLNDEPFAFNMIKTYEYLDSLNSLAQLNETYENKLFNDFAERIVRVEEKIKKKEFSADMMYFTYCRTALNNDEKESVKQEAIKEYSYKRTLRSFINNK